MAYTLPVPAAPLLPGPIPPSLCAALLDAVVMGQRERERERERGAARVRQWQRSPLRKGGEIGTGLGVPRRVLARPRLSSRGRVVCAQGKAGIWAAAGGERERERERSRSQTDVTGGVIEDRRSKIGDCEIVERNLRLLPSGCGGSRLCLCLCPWDHACSLH